MGEFDVYLGNVGTVGHVDHGKVLGGPTMAMQGALAINHTKKENEKFLKNQTKKKKRK